MTESLAATPTTTSSTDEHDLARLVDLERQLGRQLGRPLVIKHLGVTDARARKLIAARNSGATTTPAHHQPPDGATTIRHLAPAQVTTSGGTEHQPRQLHPVPAVTPSVPITHPATDTADTTTSTPPTAKTDASSNDEHDQTHTDEVEPNNADTPADTERSPDGAAGFYLVAFLALLVSVDTSWRFFGQELGIRNVFERAVMFSVLEAALISCGSAMRAGVRRSGRPGPARWVAWTLCGVSAYMALILSGPLAGAARVALGPLLSLTMLHLALGIEIRSKRGSTMTTWARIGHEMRERALSWLGLSDDQRDALARTRDRAAHRAAKLASADAVAFRRSRLARALRKANVAHETPARTRMLAELATAKHADQLRELELPSPWRADHPSHDTQHDPYEGAATS